jgi:hypothetical protein
VGTQSRCGSDRKPDLSSCCSRSRWPPARAFPSRPTALIPASSAPKGRAAAAGIKPAHPAKWPRGAPRGRGAPPAAATRRAVGSVAGHLPPACYSPRRAARRRVQRPLPCRAASVRLSFSASASASARAVWGPPPSSGASFLMVPSMAAGGIPASHCSERKHESTYDSLRLFAFFGKNVNTY